MSRSKWKGSYLSPSLKRLNVNEVKNYKSLQIWERASVVPAFLVGKSVRVHDGKIFKKLQVTEEHVGFKFGFFIPTRMYTDKRAKKETKKGK